MSNSAIIIAAAIKYGPALGLAIAEILHRKDAPTIQEWRALFGQLKSYDDYVKADGGPTA